VLMNCDTLGEPDDFEVIPNVGRGAPPLIDDTNADVVAGPSVTCSTVLEMITMTKLAMDAFIILARKNVKNRNERFSLVFRVDAKR
jgi:hypothetical protein